MPNYSVLICFFRKKVFKYSNYIADCRAANTYSAPVLLFKRATKLFHNLNCREYNTHAHVLQHIPRYCVHNKLRQWRHQQKIIRRLLDSRFLLIVFQVCVPFKMTFGFNLISLIRFTTNLQANILQFSSSDIWTQFNELSCSSRSRKYIFVVYRVREQCFCCRITGQVRRMSIVELTHFQVIPSLIRNVLKLHDCFTNKRSNGIIEKSYGFVNSGDIYTSSYEFSKWFVMLYRASSLFGPQTDDTRSQI